MANAKETKKLIKVCLEADVVPIIWGFHGIGKTDLITDVAKEYGGELRKIHLANHSDPGDLVGLPIQKIMEELERTVFAIPDMWPTGGKGIIFLDELNRAQPPIIQAMYPFILDRSIGRYKLPPGWRIIVACNPPGGEYIVNPMDDAKMTRFFHISYMPTVDEWIEWAETESIHSDIVEFVRANDASALFGADIVDKKVSDYIKIHPKPRLHELLSKMLYAAESLKLTDVGELIAIGLLGLEVGTAFSKFRDESIERPIPGGLILDEYHNYQQYIKAWSNNTTIKISVLRKTAENVTEELRRRFVSRSYIVDKTEVDAYCKFLADLPREIVTATIRHDLADKIQADGESMNENALNNINYEMHALTIAVYKNSFVEKFNKETSPVEEQPQRPGGEPLPVKKTFFESITEKWNNAVVDKI